jgi:hypothetical protein
MSLALNSHDPGGPSRLDLLFDRIATWAPFAAGFISWVRQPSSRLVRIPLAFLLIFGGIFSFLPILGVWMLPLGFLILALDIPPLQGPVVSTIEWVERKWAEWKNRKK